MKFQFRFERLLAFREEMEKRQLMQMASVQRGRDQQRQRLDQLLGEAQNVKRRWEGLQGKTGPMEEIRLIHRRWSGLWDDVQRQRGIVDDWEAKLREARDRWVEARKAKKMLMLLKERAFEGFMTAMTKAEIQQLDEVSLRPFVGKDA